MPHSAIHYNGSVAVDLARIKCLQIIPGPAKKHILLIELNGRIEYSIDPFSQAREKDILHEEVRIEYDDYEMAQAYLKEWVDAWQAFNLENR